MSFVIAAVGFAFLAAAALLPASASANTAPTCLDQQHTIEAGQPLDLVIECTDPEEQSLSYSIVDWPAHGSLEITSPNTGTYWSSAEFSGEDTITYRAYDGIAYSNTATITIEVTPGSFTPVPQGAISGTVIDEDEAPLEGICVTAHTLDHSSYGWAQTDPNGDYTLENVPSGSYIVFFESRPWCDGGNYVSQYFDDKPDADSADPVEVLAEETTEHIDATLRARGPNNPPVCPVLHAFVASDGFVDLHGNCVDPDGDPISYALVSQPTGGTLQILGSSSVRYTPDPGTTSDSFVYSASDGWDSRQFTVQISVTDPTTSTFETAGEASEEIPYVASVTTTQPGSVTIDSREVTAVPPTGFFLLNHEFDITAPDAEDAENPLRLAFTFHSSVVTPDEVTVFRNGEPVAGCHDPGAGVADPDPCVEEATSDAGTGDLRIVVLTTRASLWNFGVGIGGEATFDFSGFFAPVENRPAFNVAKAGSAIPVKFSLGGDQGLDVFATGYPAAVEIPCDSEADLDGIESTVNASSSGLSYDAASDRYTYVWKTKKEWTGCRQLVLRFNDAAETTRRASFLFRAK